MKSLLVKSIALALLLITAAVFGQTDHYAAGQQALRQQDWEQAYAAFTRAAEDDPERADAATYWRGYVLFKAGRDGDAQRVLRRFDRRFADSNWRDDVRVLLAEHDGDRDLDSDNDSDLPIDEETRLFLLAQLMERDPGRALPLLQRMLSDNNQLTDRNARRNALFIIAMSDDEDAQRLISETARDSSDPLLQIEAIQVLGASGSDQAVELITDIYRASDDRRVKSAVLQASMVADEPALALDILRNESDPELQTEAIQMLGVMDETEQLHRLYSNFSDRRVREAVLQALMVADDSAGLRTLIDNEQDPDLRRAAIRNLALTGDLESSEALEQLYDSARSVEEKRVVIEALFVVGDDGEALALKIARQETDPQLRRQAIEALGVMDAPQALLQLYPSIDDQSTRQLVIQGLMIADATDELIGLLQSETDPMLRAELIRNIAISGEDDAADYLVRSYRGAARAEQDAILEAMLIMDNAEGLIQLLRQESERERKQRILQTLMAVDSDEATEYLLGVLEDR